MLSNLHMNALDLMYLYEIGVKPKLGNEFYGAFLFQMEIRVIFLIAHFLGLNYFSKCALSTTPI